MKTPTIRYADHLKDWSDTTNTKNGWVYARPISLGGIQLIWRIKCAWEVFTGKSDVLRWYGDQ